jgi:hypothetical protein
LRATKERGFLRESSDMNGGDDELLPIRGGQRGGGSVDRVARGSASKRSAGAKATPPAKSKEKVRKSRRRS